MKHPYLTACAIAGVFIVAGVAIQSGQPGATLIILGVSILICATAAALENSK